MYHICCDIPCKMMDSIIVHHIQVYLLLCVLGCAVASSQGVPSLPSRWHKRHGFLQNVPSADHSCYVEASFLGLIAHLRPRSLHCHSPPPL